ncbi:pseudouridine synthase [Corynebacterium mayonis]|uniref:pseudouridine synthase n=1 Tax=Corynebacterium mayonis TaxID=3062461 RepID=UPI00313FE195
MARKKSAHPLPPRGGLSASRVRLPGTEAVTAWEFIERVIATQRHKHPDDNSSALSKRFQDGEVVLRDGTPLSPTTLIAPGTDVFFYRRPAPETPVPFNIETLYEDENIMVVIKPPFLATMPRAAHITETATVRLRRATGNEELTPAHRLDRETQGLLMLTKRREIRGAYQQLFANRAVEKRYEAIAADRGLRAPATWQHHIVKKHGDIAATIVDNEQPNAHTELLAVSPLNDGSGLARYVLAPVTGRTHQLRVQMHHAGVPILHDAIYPEISRWGEDDFSRPLQLASTSLRFVDPLSATEREFIAPGL